MGNKAYLEKHFLVFETGLQFSQKYVSIPAESEFLFITSKVMKLFYRDFQQFCVTSWKVSEVHCNFINDTVCTVSCILYNVVKNIKNV